METTSTKSTATLMHLSALTQYFIPFGNFIFPIVIWSTTKKNSNFNDYHGRQIINFQLSLFLYTVILAMIAFPILLFTIFKNVPLIDLADGELLIQDFSAAKISGIVTVAALAVVTWFFLKVTEFFLIINASVKAANGELYKYPLTINFIKPTAIRAEPPIETTQPQP